MNIAAPLGDKATITFGMIGTKAEEYTVPVGATFAAATTSDMMVTTNGSLTEDGDAITYATEWNATLDNGMEAAFSLFQREAYCVTNGIASVSGTMSAYLKDGTLWAKVLNETETNHVVVLEEGVDSYTIELPIHMYGSARVFSSDVFPDVQTVLQGLGRPNNLYQRLNDSTTQRLNDSTP